MNITKFLSVFFAALVFSITLHAKSLVVYTYDSFTTEWGPGPQLAKLFEEECDCTLKFIGLEDGGAIMTRIKLEGKHTQADIALGIDNTLVVDGADDHFFDEHGVVLPSNNTLPLKWQNTKFLPFDYGWFAFVYNSEKVQNPPQNLKEFVNSPGKSPSLIIQDPRISTPGLGFLLWMKTVFGDSSQSAWQSISKKIVTVTPGWSDSYALFLQGEADMVLSYTTSPAYHAITDKDPRYKSVLFNEGNYIQIELAGILNSSKNKKTAKQFLQFLISKPAQKIIPLTQWMFPVIGVELPAGFADNARPKKTIRYPKKISAQEKKAWLREWQNNLK